MIKSMTGFGVGASKFEEGDIKVEIKTLNHKFFELASRLPNGLSFLEMMVKDQMQKKIKRGRVTLGISLERKNEPQKSVSVDKVLARKYKNILSDLKGSLDLKGEIKLEQIASLPDVLKFKAKQEDYSKYIKPIKEAIDAALVKVIKMRQKDGAFIYKDLYKRAKEIEISLMNIKKRSPLVIKQYRDRLWKTLKLPKIANSEDAERLEREVALFAKNCDISEEVSRMYSHAKSFIETLKQKEEAGRTLDFIAQELYREVNTIGAKASDYKIQEKVIKIKSQIEKIREQVQNVE